jgi:hypothetical protein
MHWMMQRDLGEEGIAGIIDKEKNADLTGHIEPLL